MSKARDPVEEPGEKRIRPDPGLLHAPLGQLVDVAVLRTLMDGAFELAGIPAAIKDLDGNVVLKSEWHGICDSFHRSHPETVAACQESDTLPARNVPPGSFYESRCRNGPWDLSAPLRVGGRHVGNLFVGQFFYEDEDLELEPFRERARRLGFDETAYLEAVERVPRWSREKVASVMRYYTALAEVMSAVATRSWELARVLAEQKRLVASVEESRNLYQALFEHAPMSIWEEDFSAVKRELDSLRAEGVRDVGRHLAQHPEVVARCAALARVVRVNETSARVFGVARKEDLATYLPDYLDDEWLPAFREALVAMDEGKTRFECEVPIRRPGPGRRQLHLSLSVVPGFEETLERIIVTFVDTTERKRAEEAIRSSEEQYRRLVEHLQAGVVVHGSDSRIRFLNPQACGLLGLSRDEAKGMAAVDAAWCFLSEDGRRMEVTEYPVSQVIATGRSIENLVLGIHDPRSGEDKWVLVTAFPETDVDGALLQVVVSFIDITAQRRAQAELAAVARISTLFQQALPLSTIYSEVAASLSSILRFPLAGIALYDRDAAEMVFVGVAGMDGVVQGLRVPIGQTRSGRVATTGIPICETRSEGDEGQRHEAIQRLGAETFLCVPIVVGGEVIGTVGLADRVSRRDATTYLQSLDAVARALAQELGRRKAEDALRESEERLRLAADAADLGTWSHDLQTGRARGDERSRRQFGSLAEDESLEEVLSRVHPDDLPILVEKIREASRETTGTWRGSLEYRVLRPDDEIRWLSVFLRTLVAGEGGGRKAVAIVGTSQDITVRKRAGESQLRTQKLEALGTLAGGVAHDFNNILLAIRGNASLAATELPEGHPVRDLVAEIDKAGARAAGLVRQILTFARPEEMKRSVVPLGPVLDEALRLLRATLPAQIEIRSVWHEDLPPVAVDAGQVHQAVVNLVTNAFHAIGRRPGRIDLELSVRDVGEETATAAPGIVSGPHVCLSVHDDGCGMDRVTLARVFDPFFTTKKTGEGTGLGLSIVHGIMRAHGGAVDIRSTPGRGTTVMLYFPAAEAPAEPAPAPRPLTGRRRTERILVVDDDEAIAILIRRSLGRLGYMVTSFTDPGAAVTAFAAAPDAYDAVVTDISMPGMTGFDVAGAILAARPGIPLVITSGYIRPEDEVAAARLGVKALIAKPDTVDELAGVLDRIFQAESA